MKVLGANNYDYPTDFYLWNNLGLGTALKDGKCRHEQLQE